eukprot:PhF_6_TR40696/c0_g1_i1/m.61175
MLFRRRPRSHEPIDDTSTHSDNTNELQQQQSPNSRAVSYLSSLTVGPIRVNEVLIIIFEFLSLDSLFTAAHVCSSWRERIIKSCDNAWRTLTMVLAANIQVMHGVTFTYSLQMSAFDNACLAYRTRWELRNETELRRLRAEKDLADMRWTRTKHLLLTSGGATVSSAIGCILILFGAYSVGWQPNSSTGDTLIGLGSFFLGSLSALFLHMLIAFIVSLAMRNTPGYSNWEKHLNISFVLNCLLVTSFCVPLGMIGGRQRSLENLRSSAVFTLDYCSLAHRPSMTIDGLIDSTNVPSFIRIPNGTSLVVRVDKSLTPYDEIVPLQGTTASQCYEDGIRNGVKWWKLLVPSSSSQMLNTTNNNLTKPARNTMYLRTIRTTSYYSNEQSELSFQYSLDIITYPLRGSTWHGMWLRSRRVVINPEPVWPHTPDDVQHGLDYFTDLLHNATIGVGVTWFVLIGLCFVTRIGYWVPLGVIWTICSGVPMCVLGWLCFVNISPGMSWCPLASDSALALAVCGSIWLPMVLAFLWVVCHK